ncbi:MAG: CarD family transcriptional regulator [Ardenticatenaceae bacterium]
MEYAVGDTVMHPTHGPGQITAVKHIELVEGFEHYYEIEIPGVSLTLNIPVRKMEEIGVRPLMREGKLERVLETLCSAPEALSDNYKARQAGVLNKLKSGLPIQLAQAVRDLTWREASSSLTHRDAQLLTQAQDALVAEVALVKGIAVPEASHMIRSVLDRALKREELHGGSENDGKT